jgi:hypothetical protein
LYETIINDILIREYKEIKIYIYHNMQELNVDDFETLNDGGSQKKTVNFGRQKEDTTFKH